MKYTLPIILLSVLLFNIPVFSQKGEVIKKVEKPTTKLKLSIKEAIQRAIEFSPEVKNTSFELVKTDSGFLKSESKYSWKIIGGVDSQKSALPDNQLNFFTGTKTSTDKISGGIEKVFNTGTYFKTEISSTRFD
jgi:hypothetical protein